MRMIPLQLICVAIVAMYIAARLLRAGDVTSRRAFLARFATLAVAAAIGEDTVIRAYHTYAYAPSWSIFIDRVPLVVVLVWPVVIDSAATLARCASSTSSSWRVALLAAAIVLADASLIEPIAVRAGLWTWTDPGLFHVPLVGIAGWSMFTFAATTTIRRPLVVIAIAPVATHVLILASWWILFRWIQGPIDTRMAVVVAWCILAVVTIVAWRVAPRIPVATILLRAPGAAFFFGLLVLDLHRSPGEPEILLLFYALAFAPPYVAMLARQFVSRTVLQRDTVIS